MTDQDQGVRLEIDGAIATITLNRADRHNALDGDNIRQFCQHIDTVEADSAVRVLVVTGDGEKTFCAGAALDQLGSGAIDGDFFTEVTDRLASVSIPTICAFNGSAYGGGSEIGLACDFRVGFHNMRLFVPPARIGLCYPVNGIERFVQVLGLPAANRLLLSSEDFRGDELLSIGYLTHLVEHAEVKAKVQWLAERMAGYAPLALKAIKRIARDVSAGQLDKDEANKIAQACNRSEDLKEGFLARAEKRAPQFKGK